MSLPQKPGPKNHPFMDFYPTGGAFMGMARGVVFNAEQAAYAFQIKSTPIVLCVDGPVCKWVESFQLAVNFFDPPIRFVCDECGHVMVGKDDIVCCLKCGDGDITRITSEQLKKAKEQLVGIMAGDL